MKNILLLACIFLFNGCASMNPFQQFYQDQTGGVDITTISTVILPSGEPQIYSSSNADADNQRMLEGGYSLLGYSSFNAGDASKNQLIAQAKMVKAEVAIFYSAYTSTVSGTLPLTLPDNQTTTTNLSGGNFNSGSLYGYGGYGTYSGSGSYYGTATSTTYGTKTTYIPYSQNRYDYLVTYWIKMKPPILGLRLVDLTPEQRQSIGSNTGAEVLAVIRNSPAFTADILKGDILKKINESEIIDAASFSENLIKYAGQTVALEIIRNNESLTKQLKLNTPENEPALTTSQKN